MATREETTHMEITETYKAVAVPLPIKTSAHKPCITVEHAGPSRRSRSSAAGSGSSASPFEEEVYNSPRKRMPGVPPAASFARFVECKFIPEYVARKKAAGRAHFRSILKHVLPPESVDAAFAINTPENGRTLKTVSEWPYLTSLELGEVTAESIRHLTLAALQHGYSLQTATHIRNVVRNVYAYAIQTGFHCGENPAASVILPRLRRRNEQVLTLPQLKQLARIMTSPGRELMLFTVLTEMSVVEICGLQWIYVNPSSSGKWADGEFIPPNTIAVRNQYYRGEFSPVTGSRRRFIPVAEGLGSLAAELRAGHKQSVNPQDFVLAARNGSPINPENIAVRHLKFVGHSLQIPGLSWGSLQRTRSALRSKFGKDWYRETEKAIFS